MKKSKLQKKHYLNWKKYFRLNMDGVEVDLSAEDNGPSLGDDFSDSLTELRFGDKFNSDDTNSVSDSFEEPGLDYGVEISGESIVLCSYNDWEK